MSEGFARVLGFGTGHVENPCTWPHFPLHVTYDHWWLSLVLVTYHNSSKMQGFFVVSVSEIRMKLEGNSKLIVYI